MKGTIVPRTAFFGALEALIPWACIVASDALTPLSDVGCLRLNEGGVVSCPTTSSELQHPCLIFGVEALFCEPCILLAAFFADRFTEGYLQELFRHFCIYTAVTIRLVHTIKLRASFLCFRRRLISFWLNVSI